MISRAAKGHDSTDIVAESESQRRRESICKRREEWIPKKPTQSGLLIAYAAREVNANYEGYLSLLQEFMRETPRGKVAVMMFTIASGGRAGSARSRQPGFTLVEVVIGMALYTGKLSIPEPLVE